MQNLDGKSMNIIEQNIEKLKEIFPEVFSEGKIDFSKLEEEIGNFKDDENERYNFTWNGKSEAKKIALTPSTGTLRPCKTESKDWDTTQNLYLCCMVGLCISSLLFYDMTFEEVLILLSYHPLCKDFVLYQNF